MASASTEGSWSQLLEAAWRLLIGGTWGYLGGSRGDLEGVLEATEGVLTAMLSKMAPRRPRKVEYIETHCEKHDSGSSRGCLGRILEALGGVLEACGAVLEALGGVLEALESVLEALDVVLEAMLGQDSSKQAHESENLEKH